MGWEILKADGPKMIGALSFILVYATTASPVLLVDGIELGVVIGDRAAFERLHTVENSRIVGVDARF